MQPTYKINISVLTDAGNIKKCVVIASQSALY